GTVSVVQPLIAPLLDGVSRVEMLGLLAHGTAQPGHDLVRETWKAVAADDAAWHQLLLDGVATTAPASGGPVRRAPVSASAVAGNAAAAAPTSASTPGTTPAPAAAASASASAPKAAAEEAGLDVVILPSPQVWDGSLANVAWLQELPHPLS